MNRRLGIQTIVAIGIGAAVFMILGRFGAIPTGIPNTSIETAYAFLALMAVLYGPVAGFSIGFIGHTLKDLTTYGSPWFSWILASAVVGFFEGTIQTVVSLATFMPIVTGMGGNAGTQTLTIIVRGLALGELNFKNMKKVFLKEVGVGLVSGIVIGVIIGILGFVWEGNFMFGIVIGVAMILNMIVATITGYLVPIVLKKFKVDPALASSIFVTTFTDVLGFFFFLGLATILIQYLM